MKLFKKKPDRIKSNDVAWVPKPKICIEEVRVWKKFLLIFFSDSDYFSVPT